MSTSDFPVYRLRVEIAKPYVFIAVHYVLDAFDQRVVYELSEDCAYTAVQHYRFYEYQLPKGLYTLRIVVNGAIQDRVILLDRNLVFNLGIPERWGAEKIELPDLSSSAVFTGTEFGHYRSSHGYYLDAVKHYSEAYTVPAAEMDTGPSVFIFLRYPSKELFKECVLINGSDCFDRFSLLDSEMRVHTKLRANRNAVVNREEGWMAVHMALEPGLYFLFYQDGEDSRLVPLYNFAGNYVQCFLCIADKPQFGTLRIFNTSERYFKPEQSVFMLMDVLLDQLQNQKLRLEEDLVRYAMDQQNGNASFILLTAYLYLSSASEADHELLDLISAKLEVLLGVSYAYVNDIAAIGMMRMNILGLDMTGQSIVMSEPPMIRKGFEALVNASLTNSNLIPVRSLNDFIAENLFHDSPYTTFKAPAKLLNFFNKDLGITSAVGTPDVSGVLHSKPSDEYVQKGNFNPMDEVEVSSEKETVVDFIGLDHLKKMMLRYEKNPSSLGWPLNELFDVLKERKKEDLLTAFTLIEASRNLKTPVSTLRRLLQAEKLRIQTSILMKQLYRVAAVAAVIFVIAIPNLLDHYNGRRPDGVEGHVVVFGDSTTTTTATDTTAVAVHDTVSVHKKTHWVDRKEEAKVIQQVALNSSDTAKLMRGLSDSLKTVFQKAFEDKNVAEVIKIRDSVAAVRPGMRRNGKKQRSRGTVNAVQVQ